MTIGRGVVGGAGYRVAFLDLVDPRDGRCFNLGRTVVGQSQESFVEVAQHRPRVGQDGREVFGLVRSDRVF